MDECSLLRTIGQASAQEAGEIFRDYLRGCLREMFCSVMASEVEELCGPKHQPQEGPYYRAGSSSGQLLYEGQQESIKRPRVRKASSEGKSEEVVLKTYQSGRNPEALTKSILNAVAAGVSTREVKEVLPKSPAVSKSNVSRHWQKAGNQFVEQLRSVDIASRDWCVLMLDGIRLSKEQLAVVAIGVSVDGKKHVLDFELGSSESAEVSKDLVVRLKERGFASNRPLLVVLDGSAALKSAVLEIYPDSKIQRCLVHKERNIRSKLSKKHWGELARLFKRLRKVEGEEAALEVVGELEVFLKGKNAEARKSLEEAGSELYALHSLEVPNTLHTSLLSTNSIENTFLNARRKLGRVTRFRAETDQAARWLAFSLLEAEKGYRRIKGYEDLHCLVKALEESKKAE